MLNDFLSLFYPRICITCENSLFSQENLICNHCYIKLPKSDYHLDKGNPVAKLFRYRVDLEMASSYYVFNKDSSVQELLHQIKYKNKPEIACLLGKWYGDDLKDACGFKGADVLIPVPLHVNKHKKRGYNQSVFFARGLSESMNIVMREDILVRKEETQTQTRKSRFDRWQNVENKFEVVNKEKLIKKHVILIDDVVTTGATIEACVQELKKTEGIKVSVLTIAFAQN